MPATNDRLSQAYAEIGAYLRSVRRRRSIEIAEISHTTRIRPGLVRALERNGGPLDLKGPFVRSFLRQYADALRVDISAYLKDLPSEEGFEIPKPDGHSRNRCKSLRLAWPEATRYVLPPIARQPKQRQRRLDPAAPVVPFLINAVLLGGVLTGFYHITRSETSPSDPAEQPRSVEEESPVVEEPRFARFIHREHADSNGYQPSSLAARLATPDSSRAATFIPTAPETSEPPPDSPSARPPEQPAAPAYEFDSVPPRAIIVEE